SVESNGATCSSFGKGNGFFRHWLVNHSKIKRIRISTRDYRVEHVILGNAAALPGGTGYIKRTRRCPQIDATRLRAIEGMGNKMIGMEEIVQIVIAVD